jgi:hypothetical protein
LAKYGAGRCNFIISNIAGLVLGLDRFRLSLIGSFNFTFQFIISTGLTSNEFPRTSPMQTVGSKRTRGYDLEGFTCLLNLQPSDFYSERKIG